MVRLAVWIALVALVVGATGCFTPMSPEQQSDWRWKRYNPDYPMDPDQR